jgi:hypothetical protein
VHGTAAWLFESSRKGVLLFLDLDAELHGTFFHLLIVYVLIMKEWAPGCIM